MSVDILLSCGGCEAQTMGTGPLRRGFVSFSGNSHGFGPPSTDLNSVDDLIPEGWVAFDPYTYCTYCPECWAEIRDSVEIEEL